MLARTADNMYWLARYMERADFVARIVDATLRLEALPKTYGGSETEWESTLTAAGAWDSFREAYGALTPANAIEFLTFDKRNPSSIRNCIEYGADQCARGAHGADCGNVGMRSMAHISNSRPSKRDGRTVPATI